jgi:hypothetical protein
MLRGIWGLYYIWRGKIISIILGWGNGVAGWGIVLFPWAGIISIIAAKG